MARRRRYYRRRSRPRRRRGRSRNNAGFVLVVVVVIFVLVALAARDGDAVGGDSRQEQREAQQDAEARAGEGGGGDAGGGEAGEAGGGSGGRARSWRPAAELLAVLVVRDEGSRTGYEREAFGEGWTVDAVGCDTREVVLAEESTAPVSRREDCSIAQGRWSSFYDGETTSDPGVLQIDHMVPLAEAWDSGAAAWTPARRELFANDLRRQGALVAVTAASNQSKSDRDPAEWMPPDRDAWCRYARAWIVQKHAWRLSVDAAEQAALEDVLATC